MLVTPGAAQPYKVVLEHKQTGDTEHAVGTMREGEAFIRSELPARPAGAFPFGSGRETSFRHSIGRPGLVPEKEPPSM
jgi:hypothetical protein